MPRNISGPERWRSSERIAARFLEESGYRMLEVHKKIVLNDLEVGEVDFTVEKDDVVYAVEVKAGRLDVNGVRQAYVNAELIGARPLIVCKGFADPSAGTLAGKLDVEVLVLSDVFLVDQEELEVLIKGTVEHVLEEYLTFLLSSPLELTGEEERLLKAITSTYRIMDAAEELGIDVTELAKRIDRLKDRGILPRWARHYTSAKGAAGLMLVKKRFYELLSALDRGEVHFSSTP